MKLPSMAYSNGMASATQTSFTARFVCPVTLNLDAFE